MGKEQDLLDASRSGHYNIIEKILNARVKKTGPLNLTSLRRLPGPNTADPRNGFTCLHYAALNSHKNIVRILLEHGANPNVVDHHLASPLHLASFTGDYEIVDMLISNKTRNDLKAQIDLKNNDLESALHLACRYGHTPVVSLLVAQGADPFIQNGKQETPLDLAAQYGRLETVELLLRLRFDLLNKYLPNTNRDYDVDDDNGTGSHGRNGQAHPLPEISPLHLAARNGHKSIVKLLLDLGFDVDYLTKNGTALFESVICGKNEIVRLLLESGTNVELRNEKGQKVEQLLDGLNTAVAMQTKKLIQELGTSNRNTEATSAANHHGNYHHQADDCSMNSDEQAMLLRLIQSPVTISESISTTIAASNSFCDQEDLTIVDSMLNEDIPIMFDHHDHDRHHHHLRGDHGDLDDGVDDLMDDDDHCISPPPGYTDNIIVGDNQLLDGDCVSPSSSLFSTSIFSELASIFERNPMDTSNGNRTYQQQDSNGGGGGGNQIKSSNSFTMVGGGGGKDDGGHPNSLFNINHHQTSSFHSPTRRMTTPNDHHHHQHSMKMMSTSLNSTTNNSSTDDGGGGEQQFHRKYFHHKRDNDDRDSTMMMMISSSYSISSNASSSNVQLSSFDETAATTIKQPRPPKPPRKSIDKLQSKAKSMESGDGAASGSKPMTIPNKVLNKDQNDHDHHGNNNKIGHNVRLSKFQSMSKQDAESNPASWDMAVDSSDHSASQNVDSVISNDPKIKVKKKEKFKAKVEQQPEPEVPPLPSMSSVHSIDDFYMLYDQAAREEYEQDKQDVRNYLYNNQPTKHSSSMDLLKQQQQQQQEQQVVVGGTTGTITPTTIGAAAQQDPPSPNSAETEIINKIEPLKQQFYDGKPIATKRQKRKKTLDTTASASTNASRADKRFTASAVCHNDDHSSMMMMIKRDNWTLTDNNDDVVIVTDDHQHQQVDDHQQQPICNKKSIGITVQLGDDYRDQKGARLIVECGLEGQDPTLSPSSSNKPHHHHRHRNHHNRNHKPKTTKVISKHGQDHGQDHLKIMSTTTGQNDGSKNHLDYFSTYCETLKFDRKGEKENPFAGLCRGGLTPAKSNPNNNHRSNKHQQSAQQSCQPPPTNETKKKTVELSEARKSVRKQRSILSGRAESLSKLNKLSVYNGGGVNGGGSGQDFLANHDDNVSASDQQSKAGSSAMMITQPNNIYATLRKKKKSKSLSGDHHHHQLTTASVVVAAADDHNNSNNNNNGHVVEDTTTVGHGDDHEVHRNGPSSFAAEPSTRIMDQSQQILLWLAEIKIEHYRDLLIQNGYDDLDFMDNNVMDDNDLIEIGIIQASHRELILLAAKQLPCRTPKLSRDQIQTLTVAKWLHDLHLEQYVDVFHKNGLIELKQIRNLWEIELDTMLDVDKVGHRRRILFSLSDFKSRDSLIVSDNSDALSPWLTDNASTCTNLEREREREREQQLEWKGWKHARHELVNGSCQYLVAYLGSTLVRELRGIDSTRASIGKLKTTTTTTPNNNSGNNTHNNHGGEHQHMKILLSISCQGVQFKDPKSNRLICEHEIRNIHCICQDSEDLNYFAYITKDFESNNHYCHVFMSKQTDLVTEIILTLGQAFEIAYQIVLEQYNIHVKQQQQNQHQQQQNSSSDNNNNLTNNNHNHNHENSQSSNSNYTTYIKSNHTESGQQQQHSVKSENRPSPSMSNDDDNDGGGDDGNGIVPNGQRHSETLVPNPKWDGSMNQKDPEKIQEQVKDDSSDVVPKSEPPIIEREEEQLYAVVDKSRKTKKPPLTTTTTSSSMKSENPDYEKENRPVPPIRSSSTASSNSSTGTRPDQHQQQQQQKPKPPIRVASMHHQQKPEVSPKPKNLLTKSNTVQLATSNISTKPVLARFCAYLQPEQQQQQQQQQSSTITNHHQHHQRF